MIVVCMIIVFGVIEDWRCNVVVGCEIVFNVCVWIDEMEMFGWCG